LLFADDRDVFDAVTALCARESECCSFFIFRVTRGGDRITLEIDVPPVRLDILEALRQPALAALPIEGKKTK
jgi:hypothetical protein